MSLDFLNVISQAKSSLLSWTNFENNRSRPWGLLGVDTGINDLNLAIGGLVPKTLTVIAALPSHGKTATIIPIVDSFEKNTNYVPEFMIYSWEMDSSKMTNRILQRRTGLSSKDLMMGSKLLGPEKVNLIKSTLEDIKKIPAYYHQDSLTIEELKENWYHFVKYCNEKKEATGMNIMPVGILDYVGLANLAGEGLRTHGIGEYLAAIKQMVNKTDSHFVVYCQLDKSARSKDFPDLNDLAESQTIERNSDNIVLLYRNEHLGRPTISLPLDRDNYWDSKNKALFRVVKCREFGITDFITNCDIAKNKFWSLVHEEDFPYWKDYEQEAFWKNHFKL